MLYGYRIMLMLWHPLCTIVLLKVDDIAQEVFCYFNAGCLAYGIMGGDNKSDRLIICSDEVNSSGQGLARNVMVGDGEGYA
jgi:hypothetical protein